MCASAGAKFRKLVSDTTRLRRPPANASPTGRNGACPAPDVARPRSTSIPSPRDPRRLRQQPRFPYPGFPRHDHGGPTPVATASRTTLQHTKLGLPGNEHSRNKLHHLNDATPPPHGRHCQRGWGAPASGPFNEGGTCSIRQGGQKNGGNTIATPTIRRLRAGQQA